MRSAPQQRRAMVSEASRRVATGTTMHRRRRSSTSLLARLSPLLPLLVAIAPPPPLSAAFVIPTSTSSNQAPLPSASSGFSSSPRQGFSSRTATDYAVSFSRWRPAMISKRPCQVCLSCLVREIKKLFHMGEQLTQRIQGQYWYDLLCYCCISKYMLPFLFQLFCMPQQHNW